MMAALIMEDAEAFALHAELASKVAQLKALSQKPDVDPYVLRMARDQYVQARATLHERCALVTA